MAEEESTPPSHNTARVTDSIGSDMHIYLTRRGIATYALVRQSGRDTRRKKDKPRVALDFFLLLSLVGFFSHYPPKLCLRLTGVLTRWWDRGPGWWKKRCMLGYGAIWIFHSFSCYLLPSDPEPPDRQTPSHRRTLWKVKPSGGKCEKTTAAKASPPPPPPRPPWPSRCGIKGADPALEVYRQSNILGWGFKVTPFRGRENWLDVTSAVGKPGKGEIIINHPNWSTLEKLNFSVKCFFAGTEWNQNRT